MDCSWQGLIAARRRDGTALQLNPGRWLACAVTGPRLAATTPFRPASPFGPPLAVRTDLLASLLLPPFP